MSASPEEDCSSDSDQKCCDHEKAEEL